MICPHEAESRKSKSFSLMWTATDQYLIEMAFWNVVVFRNRTNGRNPFWLVAYFHAAPAWDCA